MSDRTHDAGQARKHATGARSAENHTSVVRSDHGAPDAAEGHLHVHPTPSQIEAIQTFARTVNEAVTEMWQSIRPIFAKLSEALHEAHDRGEHFYHDGKCVICHTKEDRP